jgi:outer membrane protein assembly factor BamD
MRSNWFHTALLLTNVVAVSVLGTGCGGSRDASSDTPEVAYRAGEKYFEEFRYHKAIKSFQRVFEFGRVHDWADDAQYMLARSFYEDGQYLLSSNEFERFIGLYPSDDRAEEAAFYRAMSYYQMSPAFDLDGTDTEKAIDYLRLYLAAHPDSEHRDDIGLKIDELQEKLGKKLMETARMYERSEQYRAAVLTYQRVLDEYPTSKPVDEALFGAMRAQIAYAEASILTRQGERYRVAIDLYNRLYQLFPDSDYLKEAEVLYAKVQEKLQAFGG